MICKPSIHNTSIEVSRGFMDILYYYTKVKLIYGYSVECDRVEMSTTVVSCVSLLNTRSLGSRFCSSSL